MNRFSKFGDRDPVVPPAVVDVHQHVWPAPLIEALRARNAPPRMRGWTLELAGEPDYEVDPRAHDLDARARQVRQDGLDLALVSLSSPLGIESLPPDEAVELLDAYHEGALALPEPFGAWAAACLTDIDTGALSQELERGFVGLQLPATALLDDAGYKTARPLLEVLEDAGLPLLVHPGPARGPRPAGAPVAGGPRPAGGPVAGGGAGPSARGVGAAGRAGAARAAGGALDAIAGSGGAGDGTAGAGGDQPAWWPAVVDYVQQMHAAWYAFRAHGRPRHPRLRVCFAMLAGLAPLHSERFVARSGERSIVDPDVFLEVSSYGTRAVDAVVRVLGIDVVVNGSDRPYAQPPSLELGPAALHAIRTANALRLLYPKEVFDDVAVASPA